MHNMLKNRLVSVMAGAAIMVAGLNVASYAANGHPLLLGHSNSESKPASVSNTGKGPALSLHTSKKSPPLAVSSSKLVKHLNADKLDGLHATSLQNNVRNYVIPGGTTLPFGLALNNLPKGHYIASFDIGMTTAGTAGICFLNDGPTDIQVIAYGAVNSTFSVASGTGLFTAHKGQTPVFLCNNATATVASTEFVSRVVLNLADSVKTGSTSPARTAGRQPSLAR